MDPWAANRLTELFKQQAERRQLDTGTIILSVDTECGSKLKIKVNSPGHAAAYLKTIFYGSNPLFKPATLSMPWGPTPAPITFEAWGNFRAPDTELQYRLILARLRFMGEETPSELCFNEDIDRENLDSPFFRHTGPTLHDFIKKLEIAGGSWNHLNFSNLPQRNHLRMVK